MLSSSPSQWEYLNPQQEQYRVPNQLVNLSLLMETLSGQEFESYLWCVHLAS
jgi:hypothetical protein